LPLSNQTRKGYQMVTQSKVSSYKEEDDFMIRHGWYMSCDYELWLNGRGRAVEKERAGERAKWMKLYRGSTICPQPHIVGRQSQL
jgi:hypothetical protein